MIGKASIKGPRQKSGLLSIDSPTLPLNFLTPSEIFLKGKIASKEVWTRSFCFWSWDWRYLISRISIVRGQNGPSVLWSARSWLIVQTSCPLCRSERTSTSPTWESRENFLLYFIIIIIIYSISSYTNNNILTFQLVWSIVLFYGRKTSYLLSPFLTFEKQIFHIARYLARGRRGEESQSLLIFSFLTSDAARAVLPGGDISNFSG